MVFQDCYERHHHKNNDDDDEICDIYANEKDEETYPDGSLKLECWKDQKRLPINIEDDDWGKEYI